MEERKPIAIAIPSDARPAFSNATQVNVSDDAVIIQFAYVRPTTPNGQLLSEIILSPKHAIDFNRALDATIKKHFTRHLGESDSAKT
ncbi:MAG: DUF3467 domain-containing protein [Minisyncoccia bacterium]